MQLILKTLVTISYSFPQDQLLRTLQILQERRKQKATPTEQPASHNFRQTFYFFPLPKPAPGLPEPANQLSHHKHPSSLLEASQGDATSGAAAISAQTGSKRGVLLHQLTLRLQSKGNAFSS